MSVTSRIPKQRANNSHKVTVVLGLLFLIIGIFLSTEEKKFYALCSSVAVFSAIYIVVEIIYRLCLIVEEIEHLGSRYDTITTIFRQAFDFSVLYIFTGILCAFALVCICLTNGNPLVTIYESPCSKVLYLIVVLLIFNLLKPKYSALYQSLSINDLDGLDFGSAMAHSIFNGYLRIVLPCDGGPQKGIKELMGDFESKHGIRFYHDKLILLIPLSLHCPAGADEHSSITEKAESLDEIPIDRAGVRQRIYKNTAYKITRDDASKAYVCIEYATPLRTLHETIKNSNRHSIIYELHRKDIVLQFYLTLKALLDNDPDCKDCCDLLLYDDETEPGKYVDVGKIVLDHIDKQKGKLKRE